MRQMSCKESGMPSSIIAFFGSSKRILNMVEEIAAETGRKILLYRYGLDAAIQPAIRAVEEDCVEAIVAYRGTADLIRKNVNVPVLSIQNSENIRVDAICRLAGHAKKLLIPLTRYEHLDVECLAGLIKNLEIRTARYSTAEELEDIIVRARDEGCDTVLSGGLACQISRKYKLRHYLTVPHKAHVRALIDDAASIARANRENELWVRRSEAIMNSVSDGILSVDNDGFITMCNKQAYNLLGLSQPITGQNIAHAIPELAFTKDKPGKLNYFVRQIGNAKLVFNRAPIELRRGISGWLYTFNSARKIITGGKIVSRALHQANKAKYTIRDYVHKSELVDGMLRKLCLYAASNSTVLITGESGTGKEILASALHNKSPRRHKPFVSINCAAIPEQLIESELFGYEGGSFTGSLREGKAGIFEIADEGTIFIDEVNSLPLNVQLLLLRTLQEKEIRRIGSDTVIPLNIRVIAATNKPLIEEVRKGRLREDLFFRLSVLILEVPPLRRHSEDIPELVRHFVRKFTMNGKYQYQAIDIPDDCLDRLATLAWPGNVRELEHFVERLVLLCNGVFDRNVFNSLFASASQSQASLCGTSLPLPREDGDYPAPQNGKSSKSGKGGRHLTRENILAALALFSGKKSEAAKYLGISRVTLWRLMQKHNIA